MRGSYLHLISNTALHITFFQVSFTLAATEIIDTTLLSTHCNAGESLSHPLFPLSLPFTHCFPFFRLAGKILPGTPDGTSGNLDSMLEQVLGKSHRCIKIVNEQMVPLIQIVLHEFHVNIVPKPILTKLPPCFHLYVDIKITYKDILTICQHPFSGLVLFISPHP